MNVLLQNSLAATVLIFAIVVLRGLALHSLPKNTFCVLWTAAALRLVLPFCLESKYSVFTFVGTLLKKGGGDLRVSLISPEETQAGAVMQRPLPVLPALWLVGFCALAGFFLVSYLRAIRRFQRSAPMDGVALPKSLFSVRVRQAEGISGPLTYGFFRPVILLPEAAGWTDQDNLALALAHEYTHIRRCDCLTKLLFVAALCVHWFNPAAWLLCWLANRDIELACDESAIRFLGEARRFDYARTLLFQAEYTSGLFPLFSHFGTSAVEERVVSALKHRRMSAWRVAVACLLVAVTLTAFGTSAAKEVVSGSSDALEASTVSREPILSTHCGVTVGFYSDDSAEECTEIELMTEDGEPYHLKTNQAFYYTLCDQAVDSGYIWGVLMESEGPGTPAEDVLKDGGYGWKVLLKAEFSLIENTPDHLAYTLGGKRHDIFITHD